MAKAVIRGGVDFDSSSVGKGVNQANSHIGRMGKAMAGLRNNMMKIGVGGLGIGAGVRAMFKGLEKMAELTDIADMLGITTDQVQALDAAIVKAGGKSETMRQILMKIADLMNDFVIEFDIEGEFASAETALGELAAAMGKTMQEMRDMSKTDLIDMFFGGLNSNDPRIKAMTEKAIGMRGMKAAPAAREVARAGGIEAFTEQVRAQGGIMSAEKLMEADKALDDFNIQVRALVVQFSKLMPLLIAVMEVIVDLISGGPSTRGANASRALPAGATQSKQEVESAFAANAIKDLQTKTGITDPTELKNYMTTMDDRRQAEVVVELKNIVENTKKIDNSVKQVDAGTM